MRQLLDNLSYLDPDEAKLVVRVELWSWPRHPRWLADLFSGWQVGGVLTDLVADVCRHRPVQRQILEHYTWRFKVQFKGQYHNIGGEAQRSKTICVLCFKCINKTAPSYLSDLLEQYVPSRLLRSGSQNLLKIPPRANKKCTEKAFKHCAPYIWNSLPSDIREAKSESQFKNYLKTHLFKSHLCI